MGVRFSCDPGNTRIKNIIGEFDNYFSFPNVLAKEGKNRRKVEQEQTLLDSLHFFVKSPSLNELNEQIFVAGNLACQYGDKAKFIQPDSYKTENEQTFVMILLSAAIDAVQSNRFPKCKDQMGNEIIYANYTVGIPIPMEELKDGRGAKFRDKLIKTHEVKFLQASGAENIRVMITFDNDSKVVGEGMAAFYALGANRGEQGPIIPDLFQMRTVALVDLGGGSTERIVMHMGKPHALTEGFNRLGCNKYLDNAKEELGRNGVPFPNREGITERMKSKSFKVKKRIQMAGTRKYDIEEFDIKPYIDKEIDALAEKVHDDVFSPVWRTFPETDMNIMIGGGSIVVKDHFCNKFGNIVMFVENVYDGDDTKDELTVRLNVEGTFLLLGKGEAA